LFNITLTPTLRSEIIAP
jgi:hypothetical protein